MVNDQTDLLYYLSSNIPGGNKPVHLYVDLLQCGVGREKKKTTKKWSNREKKKQEKEKWTKKELHL